MNSSDTEHAGDGETTPDPVLVWSSWPMRERPGRAAVAISVIAVVGATVGWLCAVEGLGTPISIACGVGSAGLLVLGLHKFFFASRFSIDEEGITATHFVNAKRVEWAHVRRFLHDARGGYLSRRAVANRLDAWQGLHLQWPMDDALRARAIAEIRQRSVQLDPR